MKVVHLIDTMEMGGAERLVASLCRIQREQGIDVAVHCLYRIGVLGEELRAEDFEVTLHRPVIAGGRAGSVYKALRSGKPDVVHCHNATATILGAVPARLAGVNVVIATRHGIVARPYSYRQEIKFGLVARYCDWVVAVCQEAEKNLAKAPLAVRTKIRRIYNGSVPPITSSAQPPQERGFTLLHVARLAPAKDQQTLLRAMAIAAQAVPDLHLWIVGDGPLRRNIETTLFTLDLVNRVTLFGEQPNPGAFFRAADLFVLSSLTEGVPITLLEALSTGLPAVATDVGGVSEVAQLTDSIITVPASCPIKLAKAIVEVARMRNQLPQLRQKARECYLANFTLDRMAAEYMSLYTNAIAREQAQAA